MLGLLISNLLFCLLLQSWRLLDFYFQTLRALCVARVIDEFRVDSYYVRSFHSRTLCGASGTSATFDGGHGGAVATECLRPTRVALLAWACDPGAQRHQPQNTVLSALGCRVFTLFTPLYHLTPSPYTFDLQIHPKRLLVGNLIPSHPTGVTK